MMMNNEGNELSTWDASTISVVKNAVDNDNSLAAIQGTLRMSGIFAHREDKNGKKVGEDRNAFDDGSSRYIPLVGNDAPDPAKLVDSMRIYTMFPQMPNPMPLPSKSSSEELKNEILSRPTRMLQTGRNPHVDKYGRIYTHISTSNVSNTIHGIYLTLDVTNYLDNDDDDIDNVPPALDLFGKRRIQREWVSLEDLKVLDPEDGSLGAEDTKPTFISGFIVRQLIKDGSIKI